MDSCSTLWYICKYCKRCYRQPNDLKSHKKQVHKLQYQQSKRIKRQEKRERELRENNQNGPVLQHVVINSSKSTNVSNEHDKSPPVNTSLTTATVEEEKVTEATSEVSNNEYDEIQDNNSSSSANNENPSLPPELVAFKKTKKKRQLKNPISSLSSNIRNNKNEISVKMKRIAPSPSIRIPSSSVKYISETVINNKRIFTCHFCTMTFTGMYKATLHVNTHTGERTYKCRFCIKTFTNGQNCKSHERAKHTGEKPYECGQCSLAFVSWIARKEHKMKMHLPGSPTECKESVVSVKNDKRMSSSSSFQKNEIASISEEVEQDLSNSEIQKYNLHGLPIYVCECCLMFSDMPTAISHAQNCYQHNLMQNTASNVRKLSETMFEAKFGDPYQNVKTDSAIADNYKAFLNSSMNGQSNFTCTGTTTLEALPSDRIKTEIRKTKKKKRPTSSLFSRAHSNIPETCPICKKVLYDTNSLIRHMYVHTGEKQYKCGHFNCTAQFSRPGAYKKHLNTHISSSSGIVGCE